jgi:valyl-tRNA synthetase
MNQVGQASGLSSAEGALTIEDRWIVARLNATAETANRAIEQYRYHEFAQILWHFFWHEFCDWYLELKKVSATGWDHAAAAFETALRLLHPAMPFLTEELWQRLDKPEGSPVSIALAPYPQYRADFADPEAEKEIGILQEIVTTIRTMRAYAALDTNAQVGMKHQLTGTLYLSAGIAGPARAHQQAIQKLGNVNLAFAGREAFAQAASASGSLIMKNDILYMRESRRDFDIDLQAPCPQVEVDPQAEAAQRKRLDKEREQLEKNIANGKRQLTDETFLSKAPAKVVDSIRAKLEEYEAQLAKMS